MSDYSILVVEDEEILRRLLEFRLSKLYKVRTADNGVDALAKLAEHTPDLIISDIMMPKMDGFQLQQHLQEQPATRAIPFIFLTAKADDSSRLKGLRMGIDDYITKPFDLDQLLSRIDRLLERTRLFQTQLGARIGMDFSNKLMPKRLPEVGGYAMSFFNRPREHGGGDLFDWTEASPGVYFFTIGDVMGKGLQAKFYAFSFLSYIRGTLYSMLKTTQSPADLIRRVNQIIMEDEMMDDTFASLLLMRWEPAKNQITYTNAGHCRPVLVAPDRTEVISESDVILGLDKYAEFTDTTIELPAGASIVTYTDGLLEQRLQSGEMLGEEGIARLSASAMNDADPIAGMLRRILEQSKEPAFADDILVFWLNRLVEQHA
ncbi:MAG: SpoIIE family protein phosphatase [Rhodothermales bacterium]|nr:SpoIIE family protein phosphatase [Rhodothermales bacterium]